MAQVFIFNMAQSPVSVGVNTQPMGTLAATSVANRYAPSAPLAVDRAQMPEPGRFGLGHNLVILSNPGGPSQRFQVTIDPRTARNADFQLCLFSRHAVFVAGGDALFFELQSDG
jgi:hypothetical protein